MVTNMAGQVVLSMALLQAISLDVSDWKAGVYAMRAIGTDGRTTSTLLVVP